MSTEEEIWGGPFSWDDVEAVRDPDTSDRERVAGLDRLAVGASRRWKTKGYYAKGKQVPPEFGYALATTAGLPGVSSRHEVKLSYLRAALWHALAAWTGERTPEQVEQILKRTRAEANRALAGDSKDKNLSECRQLPTDGRNYSMEAELRRAAVEDTDEARALPIPPEAWDAHQADESSLGPQEEDAAFESDPRYLTIRAEASPQEWKVFRFFWDNPGAKPKEIARAFDLSTSTVRVHWKHLRDKFPK